MRLLLDTQIFIWFLLDAPQLRQSTRDVITNLASSVCVSHISFFGLAIKQKIGKLPVLTTPIPKLISLAQGDDLFILPIVAAHIASYDRIPMCPATATLSTACCSLLRSPRGCPSCLPMPTSRNTHRSLM